jgi:hypothetical protein
MPSRGALAALAVVASAFAACDCRGTTDPAQRPPPQQGTPQTQADAPAGPLVEAATAVRDRGIAALMTRGELHVAEVWTLRWVQQASGHPELGGRIEHWTAVARKQSPKKMALLDPTSERSELPEEPGEGIRRFTTFLQAATAEPEDRALRFLMEFLDEPGDGYVTTHHYLVLLWWEESRGKLPPELVGRREKVAERLTEEQLAENEFSALFAERGFLLGAFGGACVEDLAQWAQTTIEAQEPDGLWGDRRWTLEYLGRVFDASGVEHTASLAVGLLQAYLSAAQDPDRRCREGT